MKEIIALFVAAAIASAVFTALVVAITYPFMAIACHARWLDHEARYGMFSGCQVHVDGVWFPEANLREDP